MPKLKPDPNAKRRNRVSVSISKEHGAITDRLRDDTGKSRAEIVEISLELAEKYFRVDNEEIPRINPTTHPGLYEWLSREYADSGKVTGRHVLRALEDLKMIKGCCASPHNQNYRQSNQECDCN